MGSDVQKAKEDGTASQIIITTSGASWVCFLSSSCVPKQNKTERFGLEKYLNYFFPITKHCLWNKQSGGICPLNSLKLWVTNMVWWRGCKLPRFGLPAPPGHKALGAGISITGQKQFWVVGWDRGTRNEYSLTDFNEKEWRACRFWWWSQVVTVPDCWLIDRACSACVQTDLQALTSKPSKPTFSCKMEEWSAWSNRGPGQARPGWRPRSNIY